MLKSVFPNTEYIYSSTDTLCYCDQFCNRTTSHDDCCPDYEEVCLGITPPEPLLQPCRLNGKTYVPPSTAMKDCNTW